MQKKQKYLNIMLSVFAVFLLTGALVFQYRSSHPVQTTTAGRLTAILYNEQNIFWKKTWEGLREEAAAEGFDLSEYQVGNMESIADYLEIAILSDTNGIIFDPSTIHDQESVQLISEASDKGICLVALDAGYEDVPVIYIGIDNISSSQKIAEYIHTQINGEKILLLNREINYSSNLKIRQDTIWSALADMGHEGQLCLVKIPNDSIELREYLSSYLSSLEEPAFLICIGPGQTLTAAKTVLSLNASDQFRIVGFGESEETIELLEEHAIEALLIQDNKQMGSLAIQCAGRFLAGENVSRSSYTIDNFLYTND